MANKNPADELRDNTAFYYFFSKISPRTGSKVHQAKITEMPIARFTPYTGNKE